MTTDNQRAFEDKLNALLEEAGRMSAIAMNEDMPTYLWPVVDLVHECVPALCAELNDLRAVVKEFSLAAKALSSAFDSADPLGMEMALAIGVMRRALAKAEGWEN